MQTAMERVLSTGLVDAADIARALKTTQRSVQRWSANGVKPRKETEERLLEIAVVLEAANRTVPAGGARLWLRAPSAALDWRKPLDVAGEGGFLKVINALEALAGGAIC